MMRIILNQSGLIILSSLKPFSSYTASEISEASKFSPALSHYLGFTFSSGLAPRHEIRTQAWVASALGTILNSETPDTVCKTWSLVANELLQSTFQECFKDSKIALFAL